MKTLKTLNELLDERNYWAREYLQATVDKHPDEFRKLEAWTEFRNVQATIDHWIGD